MKAGVAIAIGKRLAPLVREKGIQRDTEGRLLAVPIRTLEKGIQVWIIAIYAPDINEDKEQFWTKQLPDYMRKIKMKSSTADIVIAGLDANIAWEPQIDMEWKGEGPATRGNTEAEKRGQKTTKHNQKKIRHRDKTRGTSKNSNTQL